MWSRQFRCTVVKQGTDLATRQLIAGKTQAAQSTVLMANLSDRVRWFLSELKAAADQQDTDQPVINRTQLLRITYLKTGCREREDGSMVCSLSAYCAFCHTRYRGFTSEIFQISRIAAKVRGGSPGMNTPVPQESWSKSMVPIAEWCLHCGDDVVRLVERMEKGAGGRLVRISPNTFKVLEGMYDPQDFLDFSRELSNEEVKITAARVRQIATSIIRRRHWTWNLLHPDLSAADIHPSRRVHLSLAVCKWSVVFRSIQW